MSMMNRNSTSPMENSACCCRPARRHRTFAGDGGGEEAHALKRPGILATLPATIMMAMASPMARPTPSTTAAAMPLLAAGTAHPEIGLRSPWRPVPGWPPHTPSARPRRAVSATLMMEGRIMTASTRMAASRLAPRPGRRHADGGHQHEHTHQAVHHRRDACQQAAPPCGARPRDGAGPTLARYTAVIRPTGTPSSERSRRAVDSGEDEGQDAELRAGGGVGRRPHLAEEESGQSDLPDGRETGDRPDTR